jgi:hypothetical protein
MINKVKVFMNKLFKQINILLWCAAIAMPLHGMETEKVEQPVSQAWYKKRSVHVIGAAATSAIAFTLAVRMGKIVLPAFIASLFVAAATNPIKAEDVVNMPENNDNIVKPENIIDVTMSENPVVDSKNGEDLVRASKEVAHNDVITPVTSNKLQATVENTWGYMKREIISFKDSCWGSIKRIRGENLLE